MTARPDKAEAEMSVSNETTWKKGFYSILETKTCRDEAVTQSVIPVPQGCLGELSCGNMIWEYF